MPAVSIRSKKTRPKASIGAGSSKSLQKALRILLHMGQKGPEMRITELASALALNKTTVYRLLSAMEKFGFIEKNPETKRYRLGLKLHELGCHATESRTLQGEAHGFLMELSRRSNESVSLAVPGAEGVVCVDRVDSSNSIITARTPIGGRFPAHCTAAGKAVLAYLPDAEANAILSRNGLRRFTSATLIRLADVKENFELVRQRGYALDHGELERGLSGVAAPVFSPGNHLVAAVGIAGPTGRFLGKDLAQKIALARDFAARISTALGRRASEFGAHW